jgi:hypothetical protein
MKRRRQIVFNALKVLSLLLCVAIFVVGISADFLTSRIYRLGGKWNSQWGATLWGRFYGDDTLGYRIIRTADTLDAFALGALFIYGLRWADKWNDRRKLSKLGCCSVCGYDLRATPDQCPECGTMPDKANA